MYAGSEFLDLTAWRTRVYVCHSKAVTSKARRREDQFKEIFRLLYVINPIEDSTQLQTQGSRDSGLSIMRSARYCKRSRASDRYCAVSRKDGKSTKRTSETGCCKEDRDARTRRTVSFW